MPGVQAETADQAASKIRLANGTPLSLSDLDFSQLLQLQWEQEQAFAQAIVRAPKLSQERRDAISAAYDAIGSIMAARQRYAGAATGQVNLGSNDAYLDLALTLLRRQGERRSPSMFEVGFGSGELLAEVAQAGFLVGGIEVSPFLRDQAVGAVSKDVGDRLLLGSLLDVRAEDIGFRPTLIYWNDVMEHIAPDEVSLYLAKLHELLAPGGMLVTVTPNWLLRPCDITRDFRPLRTEAQGLHLKEYRLGEVVKLMKQAGFARVTSPLCAIRGRFVIGPLGMTGLKRLIEPFLDRAPLGTMQSWCTRLALSCSIAMKST